MHHFMLFASNEYAPMVAFFYAFSEPGMIPVKVGFLGLEMQFFHVLEFKAVCKVTAIDGSSTF